MSDLSSDVKCDSKIDSTNEFDELNSELESLLADANENDEVVKYLQNHLRYLMLCRFFKWLFIISVVMGIVGASIYYISTLNWNASAIGRLMLIKWVLPFYDWTPIYNSRCLIENWQTDKPTGNDAMKAYDDFSKDDCAVCESLGNFHSFSICIPYGSVNSIWKCLSNACQNLYEISQMNLKNCMTFSDDIDRISNTSYVHLQNVYLSRDHPVIITDSHNIWHKPNADAQDNDHNDQNEDKNDDFIAFLLATPKLSQSIPCNIATNLLQLRNGHPRLRSILQQIPNLDSVGWFLHFRNCEFDAVKASRAIFSHQNRPYFLSSHLPPFHSSWLMLSKNYEIPHEKRLPLTDLVMVHQLNGGIIGRLTVPKECANICSDLEFKLNAGETLVFNAQMWQLYYANINLHANLTITFIREILAD